MATDDVTTSAASHLGRLNDLDEYKVADGYPDIRGWDVKAADGTKVGKVGDLIVDTAQMRVRYLDVEVDRSLRQLAEDAATPGDQEAHTLVPIGRVELDDRHDDILVSGYTAEQIAGLPRYGGQSVTREYERSLLDPNRAAAAATAAPVAAAAGSDYEHTDYDDQRLYAKRRSAQGGAEGAQRLTLAEEQLQVGTRQVSAGEVELRKTVETEHVQEQVQLQHEEVTVERRPLAAGASAQTTIGEDEIRIPVMEEQVVMQKVLVPREEIIVRKKQVTENQTVGADVRRERLVTDGLDQQHVTVRGASSDADRRA